MTFINWLFPDRYALNEAENYIATCIYYMLVASIEDIKSILDMTIVSRANYKKYTCESGQPVPTLSSQVALVNHLGHFHGLQCRQGHY